MKHKLLCLVLLITVFLTGCSGIGDVPHQRSEKAKKNGGDILIGVAWPFAAKNGMLKEGVEMAASEINAAGGVLGRKIRLIEKDDESSVTKGMVIAQSFAENLDVVAVIGHRSSYVSLPVASIYENAGLLMLTPASTAPSLTQHEYKRVFRNIPSDEEIGKQMANYAAGKGLKRIVIFYADDEYGRGLANSFEDKAGEHGISLVDRLTYFGDDKQFNTNIEKWKLLGVDAIFVADVMPRAANFISKVRQSGINVPILGGDGLESPDLWSIAAEKSEGVIVASIFNPMYTRPEVQWFVQNYQKKYGSLPSKWAAQGYDSVKLIAESMKKANSTDPDQIASVLRKLKDWPGVTGLHTFNEKGDVAGNLTVKKIMRSGNFEFLSD